MSGRRSEYASVANSSISKDIIIIKAEHVVIQKWQPVSVILFLYLFVSIQNQGAKRWAQMAIFHQLSTQNRDSISRTRIALLYLTQRIVLLWLVQEMKFSYPEELVVTHISCKEWYFNILNLSETSICFAQRGLNWSKGDFITEKPISNSNYNMNSVFSCKMNIMIVPKMTICTENPSPFPNFHFVLVGQVQV